MNKEVKELLNKCGGCKALECIRLWIYIYRHTKDKEVCRRVKKTRILERLHRKAKWGSRNL